MRIYFYWFISLQYHLFVYAEQIFFVKMQVLFDKVNERTCKLCNFNIIRYEIKKLTTSKHYQINILLNLALLHCLHNYSLENIEVSNLQK